MCDKLPRYSRYALSCGSFPVVTPAVRVATFDVLEPNATDFYLSSGFNALTNLYGFPMVPMSINRMQELNAVQWVFLLPIFLSFSFRLLT